MRRFSSSAVMAFGSCLLAGNVGAATFDIVFDVPDAATDEQRRILAASEFFWESVITGYQDGIEIDAVTINVNASDVDGPGGTLAFAGPETTVEQGGFVLPTTGFMEFDLADLADLENVGSLFDTLNHEVAHVLGFGTLWEENGLYESGSGEYTGADGLAQYRAEFDADALFVPVELDFGDGTAEAHWDEEWAGGSSALLTGIADPPEMFTRTTLASFKDLGYTTVSFEPAPVPLPAAFWLMLAGLGPLSALRWRRAITARRRPA